MSLREARNGTQLFRKLAHGIQKTSKKTAAKVHLSSMGQVRYLKPVIILDLGKTARNFAEIKFSLKINLTNELIFNKG